MARKLGVFGAVVLVLALVVWAGVHNLRERRLQLQKQRTQEVTLTPADGSGDAGMPDGQGAALLGHAAPEFTLYDLSGKKVSLSDFKGKPVVLNFWATWCGPCKLEIPWFAEFATKYKPQGLVILGLSQDDGTSKDEIAAAAKKIGVNYPVLLPDEGVAKKYGGVDYLPETFYVDRKGKIVLTTAGAPSKDEMEADIRKTIAAGE